MHTELNKQPFNDPTQSSMQWFKDLIGYDYYTSRVVFEHGNNEIAFVNEGMISRIKIYVNGELIVKRYPLVSDVMTDTDFGFEGVHYRIKSQCTNWLSMSQRVLLFAAGELVQEKSDPRLSSLSWLQLGHCILGAIGLGVVIGALVNLIF